MMRPTGLRFVCPHRRRPGAATRLRSRAFRGCVPAVAFAVTVLICVPDAHAEGATRDLSQFVELGATFTTTIVLEPPPGTLIVGLEEAPPTGWIVSTISNGGTFDAATGEVKWGPFFDPGIPAFVTYDVTPPTTAVGSQCFAGTVSFGGASTPDIGGDACIGAPIPAASAWGLAAATLGIMCGATILVGRRRLPVMS